MSERDPKDTSIDGVEADPQSSSFVASFRDNRNLKIQADAHASITNAGPIMSSAVASHGGRLSTPPTEDSIVTGPGGQTMKVSTAERMGWVVRNPDGTFSDAPTGTAENTPTPQDGGQDGGPDGTDPQDGLKANEPSESNSLQVEPEMQDAITDLSQGLESIGANPVAVLGEIMSDPQGEKGPDEPAGLWSGRIPLHGLRPRRGSVGAAVLDSQYAVDPRLLQFLIRTGRPARG